VITDLIVGFFLSGASWLVNLLPSNVLPSWADPGGTVDNGLRAVVAYGEPLGGWINGAAAGESAALVLTVWAVTKPIAIARWIYQLVRGGGAGE